ncbi:MAG: hypothetical protein OHK0039_19600 [Bacteroidia bacterium]
MRIFSPLFTFYLTAMPRYLYGCLLASLLAACAPKTPEAVRPDFSAYLARSLDERQDAAHATEPLVVAPGLEVALFAAEPLLSNPTNMAIDARGRVWVCESYNYSVSPDQRTEPGGRITILSDTDGDGRADTRQIYYQGEDVDLALGIGVFGNQVFVTQSPYLFVFTDDDGDDRPDRKDTLFSGMGEPGDHSAHAVVFGPDGRFYFNHGNAVKQVLSPRGDTLRDPSGHPLRSTGHPYHGGMVYRFGPGGSNPEVLAHNFRNNYEVCIDAYGTLWQSDNDDDGNQSVRINYVMEHGNFGYLDEYTGAHWSAPRLGREARIADRHWHQQDPGVVPNMLITGAGSPTGIVVYEGDLLPPVFRGQIIHADAGPNVVRAYPATPAGAGYTARVEPIFHSEHDQWFRPTDVAIAPDGSLFVSDWYDPVVGGYASGDHAKGRIFRVAPPGSRYRQPKTDLSSLDGAASALSSPNEDLRYQAWQQLRQAGMAAEAALQRVWERGAPPARARALFVLGQLGETGGAWIDRGLRDADPQIRVAAVRLARQQGQDMPARVQQMQQDSSAAVRRELALSLHGLADAAADAAWAALARQHDGQDRWYLEALGIGADGNWDSRLAAWLADGDPRSPGGRDIVWRARSASALPLLADLIGRSDTDSLARVHYFRAFDFHRDPSKNEVLLGLLAADLPASRQIRELALLQLDPAAVPMTPALAQTIDQTLAGMQGRVEWVDLVAKFRRQSQRQALLQLAIDSAGGRLGTYAVQVLMDPQRLGAATQVEQAIRSDTTKGQALLRSMSGVGRREVLDLLQRLVLDARLDMGLRKTAVMSMGQSWWGEEYLLGCVKQQAFAEELEPVAASILFSVYRARIQDEAAQYLTRPGSADGVPLPPLRDLVATVGSPVKGRAVFQTYCQTCHVVAGEGVAFGPELTLIGDKLSKEGLFRSIIYPSEGINYGYEAYELELKSGGSAIGIVVSETATQIDLRLVGGSVHTYARADILSQKPYGTSLMPNLSQAMRIEQLTDLVSYLATLRQQTPGAQTAAR